MYFKIAIAFLWIAIISTGPGQAKGGKNTDTIPAYWQERWETTTIPKENHTDNLKGLTSTTENVVIYHEGWMQSFVISPYLKPLSTAWKYIKETYGPFGDDPHLYVLLHGKKSNNCYTSSYIKRKGDNDTHNINYSQDQGQGPRNVIDCGQSLPYRDGAWFPLSPQNLVKILENFPKLIRRGVKGTVANPDSALGPPESEFQFNDIILYDILRHLTWSDPNFVEKWKTKILEKNSDQPRPLPRTFWLKNWFLPIYEDHEGAEVINQYFTYMSLYWPRNGSESEYLSKMNFGEFVHFWSGAAGEDLQETARKTFGWDITYETELEQARSDYPNFPYLLETKKPFKSITSKIMQSANRTWHKNWKGQSQDLLLAYQDPDNHVAFYFQKFQLYSTSSFDVISKAWGYAQKTYGSFDPDPSTNGHATLHIIFHNGTNTKTGRSKKSAANKCISSNSASHKDHEFNDRHVIDCEIAHWNWEPKPNKTGTLDDIMLQIGQLVLKLSKGTGNWPAHKVSKWSMTSILVYDIYLALSLERPHDAQVWKEKQMKHRDSFPLKNTFWFRDWYLQIYDKHGGSRALNKFFSILRIELGIRGGDYTTQLNMGEFVHFWSEAAGVELYSSLLKNCQGCRTSFVWTEEDQNELSKAVKEFPTFEYLYDAVNGSHHPHPTTNLNLPLKEWQAYWNYDHQEHVTLTYHDDHVAFYVDKENTTEREAEGIHEGLSPLFGFNFSGTSLVWQTFKKRYHWDPTHDPSSSNGSILYIILHHNHDNETGTHAINSTDCAVSNNVSYADKDFDNRHVIDCELPSNIVNDNHTESLIQTRLMHSMALMLLRIHKGTGNWPGRQFSEWSMTSILIYDMYISLGEHGSALQWREEQMKDGAENHSHHHGKTNTSPHWFRDWYLKIYENHDNNQAHSGPIALSNFFSLLQENWLTKHQNYVGQLNTGEFIHFWSGAAGVSLIAMAENAFGRLDRFKMEVLEARVKYSKIVYTLEKSNETFPSTIILMETDNNILARKHPLKHPQLLNIVIKHDHVGIYSESRPTKQMNSTRIFEVILKSLTHSWSYIGKSYSKLQLSLGWKLDPNLHTIFHHMKSSGHKMCGTTASLKISTELGYQEVRNTIHCTLPVASHASGQQYLTSSLKKYDNFIPEFREILSAQVYGDGDGDGDGDVLESDEAHRDRVAVDDDRNAVPTVLDLVTLDLYFHSGDFKHTFAFFKRTNRKELHRSKRVVEHGNPKLWLDWYLPIYINYGGVSVLDKFLLLSHDLQQNKSAGQNSLKNPVLNFGELVHMWSGAAGKSLLDLADRAFGWDQNLQNQYTEARKEFPNIEYSCSNCQEIPRKQPPEKVNPVPVKEKHTAGGIFLVSIFAVFTIISLTCGAKSVMTRNSVKKLSEVQLRNLNTDEVNNFRLGSLNGVSQLDQGDQATSADLNSLPFNSQFEISKERLYIDYSRVLGTGKFGLIVHGRLKCIPEDDEYIGVIKEVQVAVKMTRPNVDVETFKELIMTIKIVAFVGPHENIVSLLGTVTSNISNREAFLALEYCEQGDLLKHLKRNRQSFTDLWTNRIGIGLGFVSSSCFFNNEQNPSVNINLNPPASQENVQASRSRITMSTLNLLQWSRQIANGMDFLGSKNVIHGDLAARNILLNAENIAKISDFGLSRHLLSTSNYSNTSTAASPWRWMAIESFMQENFTVQSDIWSFGVTLWEIFTLGKLPFPDKSFDPDFENNLTEGLRLGSPEFGNQQMYNIMMNCWKHVPSERASFAQIRADIDDLISSTPAPAPAPAASSPSQTGVRNWIKFE